MPTNPALKINLTRDKIKKFQNVIKKLHLIPNILRKFNNNSRCINPGNVPLLLLNGCVLNQLKKFKYLDDIVIEGLKDDEDIDRERRASVGQFH